MNYRRLYIPNSIIFITIVTSKRRNILIKNIELLKFSIKNAHKYYNFEIYAICVMKDHVHLLIKPNNINEYSKIILLIKRTFSKKIDINTILDYKQSDSNIKRKERDIWQRRFWEHTIRNEEDLYRHIDYIHYNPMKHYQITPRDWKYSTFNNFVKNGYYETDWCNFEDKYKIADLDYE